jgi:hypothetical protein
MSLHTEVLTGKDFVDVHELLRQSATLSDDAGNACARLGAPRRTPRRSPHLPPQYFESQLRLRIGCDHNGRSCFLSTES